MNCFCISCLESRSRLPENARTVVAIKPVMRMSKTRFFIFASAEFLVSIPRYEMLTLRRFPNTADSLPNPVWHSDFMHELDRESSTLRRGLNSANALAKRRELGSDGHADGVGKQDRGPCPFFRRAFHGDCGFASLSANEGHRGLWRP